MFVATVTAKNTQPQSVYAKGSLSRVVEFEADPTAEEIKTLRKDAAKEYEQIYGCPPRHVAVDVTVRRGKSDEDRPEPVGVRT